METLTPDRMEDRRISETIDREQLRLRKFIASRVANRDDVEDILQDVFYEFICAHRLVKPIEQVGAWLFRVARNRIFDLARRKKPEALDQNILSEEGADLSLEDLLPSPDAGPDALFARTVLLEHLEDALGELPAEQREVFLAHEVDGLSFKEIAEETGLNVNTLLSRKHYAVVHLRRRLQDVYDEFREGR